MRLTETRDVYNYFQLLCGMLCLFLFYYWCVQDNIYGLWLGSCNSIFSFMCMFCRSLFVLFPLVIVFLSFDLRILITPLVSSNYSSYPFSFLNKKSQSIICSKIKFYTHFQSNTAFKYPDSRANWHANSFGKNMKLHYVKAMLDCS